MGNVIDFGLIVLVLLQIGLVVGSYHFWTAAKSELNRISKTESRMEEINLALKQIKMEIFAVEVIPKSLLTRMEKIESSAGSTDRDLAKVIDKTTSLAAKYSAVSRWQKKDNQETDLASQEDNGQELIFPAEPGPAKSVSPNFGAMPKRRVGNG